PGAGAAQPAAQAAAPQAARPATRTYTDAELHLTFIYPSELVAIDPAQLPGAARNAAFTGDPDAESTDLLTGHCSRVLLSVGQTATGQAASGRAGGVWGSILLVALDPGCLPPKALKNRKAMDNLLKPLVTGSTQILGMAPVAPETTWPIEGYRVHFAESEGQPVVKGDLQPTEADQTMAVLAVQVGDHVLAWKIESNNKALLNRMLGSRVDFGLGTPQPLFPLQVPEKDLP
ncbi:MAG: hypothetical protein WA294_17585, partial [Acidobacteriaceae bacterium]